MLLGLAAAAGATLLPGMLNMTSVNVSLRAGRRTAYIFALGMATTVLLQAGIAVFFAGFLNDHALVVDALRQCAILVFLFLSAFFLFKGIRARVAEASQPDRPYRGSPFLRGTLLAVMNLLTVPYFFATSGWFLANGSLHDTALARIVFAGSAGVGALVIFMGYARAAHWMHRNARFVTRNINYLLSGLLLVLAVAQGLRLYF
ncbi:threonine/homoserine/homoserine lactone efflux protein [Neolewinella xylanilytica]|uniref:Threonine/homoserine/homoserine lactone efflux protein n=1 Tax=Neolewinella xylanilytica TaxID=1514080 RepID=A0A2S6I9Z8_9BACT|nr:LysE family transporter [Neolewinella xylanilytica]PPK88320.1 threonine/homoserine/homoserine lactone efflux protein [Neolewinella xylanilytica]